MKRRSHCWLALAGVLGLLCVNNIATSAEPPKEITAEWGSLFPSTNNDGALLTIRQWPADQKLPLPLPFPNITRALTIHDLPLTVHYNTSATEVKVSRPGESERGKDPDPKMDVVRLETAEKSAQSADGRITLTALDAKSHGGHAKLESHPGNHRIGFWSDPKDFVTWDYKATRPGKYDTFLTYSNGSPEGSEVTVQIGGQTLEATLKPTDGGWYGYTWIPLGKVAIEKDGPCSVTVRCRKMVGGAMMNLKAITLVPTCEGTPPVQAADGTITLHSRDATVQGVRLRYEPKPEKNTVGYWTDPKDCVLWNFTVTKPGTFDVEVLQGCGKGQGGSLVEIGTKAGAPISFTVQDTGHFQNFVPRKVGTVELPTAGTHFIKVTPKKKEHAAVMDLRQIRLIPKGANN